MDDARILFVEDEASLLELLGEALTERGFEVYSARDGAEALAMLALDARYDVIVSDVSMPGGISGIDVARRARDLQPQARVLLASGLSRAQLPALPDFVTYLPKPYRLGELLALMEPPSATD